jgi:hypothetical protein
MGAGNALSMSKLRAKLRRFESEACLSLTGQSAPQQHREDAMKVWSPAHSLDEGYPTMTRALHNLHPRELQTILRAKRADLLRAIRKAKGAGNTENLNQLRASFTAIKDALEKNQVRIAAADAADAAPNDELARALDEAVADEPAEESSEAPEELEVSEDEDFGPEPDGSTPEEDLSFDAEDEEEMPEPEEPENPVAMPGPLRKEIGDLTADYLDDYALSIFTKVKAYFDVLDKRGLTLGTDDGEDGNASLREILRHEVGNRGLMRLEPHFPEWREGVVRKITRALNEQFAAPDVPEDFVEPPPPETTIPGPEVPAPPGYEDEGENPEEPEMEEPPAEEPAPPAPSPEEKPEASTEASALPMASMGRVSFTSRAGFKPSGRGAPKMT